MPNIDKNSPWYPYQKVQEGYYDLSDTVSLPRKICDYLIDAPKDGYSPKDDNTYPRCRLWKYLFYDGAKPLLQNLPTIKEKMSVVFDPTRSETPPTKKGYRLIPQIYTKESQTDAQSRIYVYMGRTVPGREEQTVCLSVVFDIFTHYTYEANTKTDEYSRAFAMEQAIIEAFHGVNMAGIGTFYFSRARHADCGSNAMYDGETNVGRRLVLALETASGVYNKDLWENQPFANQDGTVRYV